MLHDVRYGRFVVAVKVCHAYCFLHCNIICIGYGKLPYYVTKEW